MRFRKKRFSGEQRQRLYISQFNSPFEEATMPQCRQIMRLYEQGTSA